MHTTTSNAHASISRLQSSTLHRWLIVIAVMLAAVIEVLDTTIVNVTLSHMMGALGATRDQITWVLTSYIVSAAILMPLTGYLVDRYGRRKLLLVNIIGFMLASICCGFSTSLVQIVTFRVLQGAFGASLIPLSQYILLDTFPVSQRSFAMAIWGVGIMAGPIFGPTLGGYIADATNWRWVFFINVPVCITAFVLAFHVIADTPIKVRKTDWLGLFWMTVAVGSLQIFLDRGETADWFNSNSMIFLAVLAVIASIIFICRSLHSTNNIINLKLFADRNFSLGCLLIVLFVMTMFSIIALQPMMVQQLMGYSPKMAGLMMGPRGISSAIGMIITSQLMRYMDGRIFIFLGLLIAGFTAFLMTNFHLHMSFEWFALIGFMQGFGVGFFFVPISTIAFATLSPSQQAEAAGLFSFSRSLGTSIGISLSSTFVAQSSQINWNYLINHLTYSNPNLLQWLQGRGWTLHNPETIIYFSNALLKQSSMIAFVNAFWIIAVALLFISPLVFVLKGIKIEK